MTRRAAVELSILAALAATIVILLLNLSEVDRYPPALDPESIPGLLPSWFAPALLHPCAVCELCPHRFESVERKLEVTITDRDGWHRLFWAGPETYVYDDAALVGAALRNRTAEFGGGTWIIRGKYAPSLVTEPHPCPPAPGDIELRYRLHRGAFPGEGDRVLDPSGTLAVPRRWLWFRYAFPPDRVDEFWWELENPHAFAGTTKTGCPCGAMPAQERTQERK